jgi:hypothetical protein
MSEPKTISAGDFVGGKFPRTIPVVDSREGRFVLDGRVVDQGRVAGISKEVVEDARRCIGEPFDRAIVKLSIAQTIETANGFVHDERVGARPLGSGMSTFPIAVIEWAALLALAIERSPSMARGRNVACAEILVLKLWHYFAHDEERQLALETVHRLGGISSVRQFLLFGVITETDPFTLADVRRFVEQGYPLGNSE